jgi:splicing factor 3A subunit 2
MGDRTREFGSRHGAGGPSSKATEYQTRKEQLRKLALEQVDLSKDLYFMRNHLGQYECKLCLTIHKTEGNYLAHTQGKRHQMNLSKREALQKQKEARQNPSSSNSASSAQHAGGNTGSVAPRKKRIVKIGRPGYRIFKDAYYLGFDIDYPEVDSRFQPRFRVMSQYEQKVVQPMDAQNAFQFLVVAAPPYETIGFKIPNRKIDRSRVDGRWDPVHKLFHIDLYFVQEEEEGEQEEQHQTQMEEV